MADGGGGGCGTAPCARHFGQAETRMKMHAWPFWACGAGRATKQHARYQPSPGRRQAVTLFPLAEGVVWWRTQDSRTSLSCSGADSDGFARSQPADSPGVAPFLARPTLPGRLVTAHRSMQATQTRRATRPGQRLGICGTPDLAPRPRREHREHREHTPRASTRGTPRRPQPIQRPPILHRPLARSQ